METTYLMLKNIPVLEIRDYNCKILEYDLLPVSLRYEEVNFDDIMHGWTEMRTMSIGKTNAKKILAGFGISQSNPYLIARAFHFASLTDCFWMKEESEDISWEDVDLFINPLEKAVSATALMGVPLSISPKKDRIHTPELTVQGMAAKAWIREPDGLYLYKVGKKELAASRILDILGFSHVVYEAVPDDKLLNIADEEHIRKINANNEKVVRCPILSSEELALVSWEEFQMYCEYHNLDDYDEMIKNNAERYGEMLVADFILSNEDRHGGNFGFFMDNSTGDVLGLYPLMDHDHAFSQEKIIYSQTTPSRKTLEEAAKEGLKLVNRDLLNRNLVNLIKSEKPEEISVEDWEKVLYITDVLIRYL